MSQLQQSALYLFRPMASCCVAVVCASSLLFSAAVIADESDARGGVEPSGQPSATLVPKPAKNINLKDVVEKPLPPEGGAVETQAPLPPAVESHSEVAPSPAPESPEQTAEDIPSKDSSGIIKKLTDGLIKAPEAEKLPLVLLDAEVLPGTSTRLSWSPEASFIGISAPTAVLVLNGVKPGPTFCLTGAVHGDEINGIEIVRRLVYDIDPAKLSGAVIGVPIVNLQGFRRGSRYLPDRRDLNRFFPGNPEGSSASRIAHSFFSNIVSRCDMLVDLHTGSFRRTNMPQLRANLIDPEVKNLAKRMGAIVVVQSEGAQGTLRRAAVDAGIPAVTLEAGAPHELSPDDIEHGVKSIESAMDSLGMIKRRRFWEREAEPVYYESSWVRATDGGMLFSDVSVGAQVQAGDVLGTVTDPITNRRSEIRAPFDGQIIGMALNQVMFPGFAAYHIGHAAAMPVENESATETLETPEDQAGAHGDEGVNTDDSAVAEGEAVMDEHVDIIPIEDSE